MGVRQRIEEGRGECERHDTEHEVDLGLSGECDDTMGDMFLLQSRCFTPGPGRTSSTILTLVGPPQLGDLDDIFNSTVFLTVIQSSQDHPNYDRRMVVKSTSLSLVPRQMESLGPRLHPYLTGNTLYAH